MKSKNDYAVVLSVLTNQLKQYLLQAQKSDKKLTLTEAVMIADALSEWGKFSADDETLLLAKQLLQGVSQDYRQAQGWVQVHDSVLPVPGLKTNLMDGNLPAADVVFRQLLSRGLIPHQSATNNPDIDNDVLEVDQRVLQKPMKYASFVAAIVASNGHAKAKHGLRKE